MADFSFLSAKLSLEEAEICLLGVPYDGTSSYRPGSRFAPMAIRESSYGLESYSPYLNKSLKDISFVDLGDLDLPFASYATVFKKTYKKVSQLLKLKKKLVVLGGEHLITYPVLRAYLALYPNLILVHYDAHGDFVKFYKGDPYSHATVIRRIYPYFQKKHIYQFGIRSGTKKEWEAARHKNNFFPFDLNHHDEVLSKIASNHPIYITLDLDVLDPSVFPGTGTPEPGGIDFCSLMKAISFFKDKNLVGVDVVELSPDYDPSKVSNITAAKIIREILLVMDK